MGMKRENYKRYGAGGPKRLWNNLPCERWTDGEEMKVDDYPVKNGYYSLEGGKKARVICVYHPSAGYAWDYWHKVIRSALF